MQYLRLLLLPFSWLYGVIIRLRNLAYDTGIFSSRSFNIPVISIGNLAAGGAGKSPMAEFIIRLLKDRYRLAVLSRGYGRNTKGYRLVNATDAAIEAGDEPLQFRRKFTGITVAVSEKRVEGIERLQKNHDVIVLDDAFQHRAVKAGLNILLFDYTRLHDYMLVLPAGNYREPFAGRKRADMIVITKTPEALTMEERALLALRVKPLKHQSLFFSFLRYGNLEPLFSGQEMQLAELNSKVSVFLITGIANPVPLLEKLKGYSCKIKHYDYPDHHPFSTKNIAKLAEDFNGEAAAQKLIITTEKDAQRLKASELAELLSALPVYYLPIRAQIHEPDAQKFDNLIENYVSEHLQYH